MRHFLAVDPARSEGLGWSPDCTNPVDYCDTYFMLFYLILSLSMERSLPIIAIIYAGLIGYQVCGCLLLDNCKGPPCVFWKAIEIVWRCHLNILLVELQYDWGTREGNDAVHTAHKQIFPLRGFLMPWAWSSSWIRAHNIPRCRTCRSLLFMARDLPSDLELWIPWSLRTQFL